MSYADEAALAADEDFRGRLQACLSTEAQPLIPQDPLAIQVLRFPSMAVQQFLPWVSTAPGFGDAYAAGGQAAVEDPMLLSAVQANWAAVAMVHPGQ